MFKYLKKILKAIFPLIPIGGLRRTVLRLCSYHIGKRAYIPSCLKISDLKNRKHNVYIGNRVSIGPNVTLITDSSPNNSKLIKIFPMQSSNIIIEDDAWIGANVTVLPGVTIGKCSVIGAGSVVNKDIPEYSIAFGIPAKVQKQINKNEL